MSRAADRSISRVRSSTAVVRTLWRFPEGNFPTGELSESFLLHTLKPSKRFCRNVIDTRLSCKKSSAAIPCLKLYRTRPVCTCNERRGSSTKTDFGVVAVAARASFWRATGRSSVYRIRASPANDRLTSTAPDRHRTRAASGPSFTIQPSNWLTTINH